MKPLIKDAETKNNGELSSFFLGFSVGFLVIVFCGGFLPIIAHLAGGFLAGLIVGSGMRKGAFAGFLAGIAGGVMATMLLISGLVPLGEFVVGFVSEALDLAIRIVAILLNIFGVVVAAAGGLVGGLVRAIIETS
ncbi:MAG: DUF5518 domain-containing protein [Candidatus Bathyarchaeota archaeon]|jgi:hypothetical protein|nr:DUF5518 domain-containing protein [Candidatus Bathyarchaeota archaeon A05DMB-5]MDH7558491.1 DUF5518 domain-containing protein [Candidatus Bathyarchaeota archaeon]